MSSYKKIDLRKKMKELFYHFRKKKERKKGKREKEKEREKENRRKKNREREREIENLCDTIRIFDAQFNNSCGKSNEPARDLNFQLVIKYPLKK